ncbi:MAG: hypothetical protein LBU32_22750 [Clostridiales bacterium]|nr:hypothetical protein [Clostridiales bacterium]
MEIVDARRRMAAEIEVKRSYARIFMESDALKALWQILRGSCGAAYEAGAARPDGAFSDEDMAALKSKLASAPRRELERARDDASRTPSDLESLRKRLFP